MARPHKPWYRKPRDTWYVEIAGRQVALCKGEHNRQLAEREMHRILAQEEGPTSDTEKKTVVGLFAKFLGWTRRHRAEATYDQHRHFLKSFVSDPKRRRLPPHKVTIAVVDDWLDAEEGWKKSGRHAVRTLLRAFNWAVKRGLIPKNPVAGIEVPGKHRSATYLTRDQRLLVIRAVKDRAFRDFLTALFETGARPGEVRRVTAADVDFRLGVWTLQAHKTARKTGKPRVVYMSDAAAELTRRLVAENPDGPLFLNSRGVPWTRNAVRIRFRNLRKKYPEYDRFTAYTYRKGYVTDALENGVDVAKVAELVGHTSTDMVMRHYAQLQERVKHMRAMANQATAAAG